MEFCQSEADRELEQYNLLVELLINEGIDDIMLAAFDDFLEEEREEEEDAEEY